MDLAVIVEAWAKDAPAMLILSFVLYWGYKSHSKTVELLERCMELREQE